MNDREAEDWQRLDDLRRGIHEAAGNPRLLDDLLIKALGELDYLWWKVMYLQGELELERERHVGSPPTTTAPGPRLAPPPAPPPARGTPHRWRRALARILRRAGWLGGGAS